MNLGFTSQHPSSSTVIAENVGSWSLRGCRGDYIMPSPDLVALSNIRAASFKIQKTADWRKLYSERSFNIIGANFVINDY